MTSEASIKALILAELPELTLDSPKYTEAQNQLAKVERAIKTEKGWWELPSDKLLIPEELAPTLVSQTHQVTHLGHDKLGFPGGSDGKVSACNAGDMINWKS